MRIVLLESDISGVIAQAHHKITNTDISEFAFKYIIVFWLRKIKTKAYFTVE